VRACVCVCVYVCTRPLYVLTLSRAHVCVCAAVVVVVSSTGSVNSTQGVVISCVFLVPVDRRCFNFRRLSVFVRIV